jgi:hypothetical protein
VDGGPCLRDGCGSSVKEGGSTLGVAGRVGDKTCYGSAGQVSGGFSGNGIHIGLQGIADGFEGGLNFVGPIDQLDHLLTDLASINGEHWVELMGNTMIILVATPQMPLGL